MKRSELFFSSIQVPVDFAMIVLAGISAYTMRNIPEIMNFLDLKNLVIPFGPYMEMVLLVAPVIIFTFFLEGLYDIRSTRKFWKEIFKVFTATTASLVIVIIAVFLKREWFSSRFIILAVWILSGSYVIIARYFIQLTQKYLLRTRDIGVHRVLLIGSNGKLDTISKLIKQNKNLGYKIIAQVDSAHLKEIKQIREERGIDEIILCEPSITEDEQEKLIDYCAINNIVYKYIPTTFQTANYHIGVLNGEPLIEVLHTPLDGWGKIIKRIFDILASIFGILVTSPIMILTAIAIKLDDGGKIIYKNERIGDNGKKFFTYKFRYMKENMCTDPSTEEGRKAIEFEKKLIVERSVRQGPLYKIKNDPRKTRVGNFIEKYTIDELPQFFNVLFGTMSMVGPRPHQEREVEKYMDYHRRLLTIKPGVTGMAQVSGRSDLDFEKEYKLDLFYIENWSLWLDIQICLKTFGVLIKKRRN